MTGAPLSVHTSTLKRLPSNPSIHPTSHLSIHLSILSFTRGQIPTCGAFLYRLGNPMIDCRLSIIYKINFLSPSFSVFLLIYFVHALMHFTLTIFRILCCISYCRSPFQQPPPNGLAGYYRWHQPTAVCRRTHAIASNMKIENRKTRISSITSIQGKGECARQRGQLLPHIRLLFLLGNAVKL